MTALPEPDLSDVDAWLRTASVEERCALLAGRDFWSLVAVPALGLPAAVVTDGPHGVRLQASGSDGLDAAANAPATCFPTAAALAATWDPDLVERVGAALAVESRALGVSVLLGPGANIKRNPLCGRNFEYFSEDPLLSSAMASAWVRGLQGQGVAASLKHFAVNNQERLRFSVDAVVDERALREIYLASFEDCVRTARPATVMCAYNRVGGEYASQNAFLLDQVLREEWGYDGLVMSDWGAVDDRVAGLRAGLDLQMPGVPGAAAPLVAAVRSGRLAEDVVDRAVRRVVRLARATRSPADVDVDAHHRLAEQVCAAGSVLLVNDGVLPLDPGTRLAVIGDFATTPRFQGAGSSVVNARRVVAALPALRERFADVTYARGYERFADEPDPGLVDEAVRAAAAAEVAVVMVGLPETFETEGADRAHLRLPAAHDALVRAVARANPRTVVVLSSGSAVEMPWLRPVAAVLGTHLGGQESGGAVARMLCGDLEPGGRLAETLPRRWSDHPVHDLPTGPRYSEYRESLYVGYRWFDTVDADVAFPFGHGLGYTTFAWSDVATDAEEVRAGGDVRVRVTVRNTGSRAGSDVVQVYVRPLRTAVTGRVHRPAHELKAFRKVHLAPGESRTVELVLPARAFAHWSPASHGWVVAPGEYAVEVAASSRDVRGSVTVRLTGDLPEAALRDVPPPGEYLEPRRGQWFDRAAFEALLGRPLAPNVPDAKGSFTRNTPLAQLFASPVGARLRRLVADRASRTVASDEVSRIMVRTTLDDGSPRLLRSLGRLPLSDAALDAIVDFANGRRGPAVREAARHLCTGLGTGLRTGLRSWRPGPGDERQR